MSTALSPQQIFTALLTSLEDEKDRCVPHIEFCKTSWLKLSSALQGHHSQIEERAQKTPPAARPSGFGIGDETMWTFLVAVGYAAAQEAGVEALSELLTGRRLEGPQAPKIWLEALPYPPRQKEGSTHLDMALGHIQRRNQQAETEHERYSGGIRLDETAESTWVAFCEMKCFSDLSTKVTHDLERTQLLRVIDNAISFQTMTGDSPPRCVDLPVVTLVTPRRLWQGGQRSRLYHFLYRCYQKPHGTPDLMDDLRRSHQSGSLPYRVEKHWIYPESQLPTQLAALEIRQVSFDELFEALPDSPLREPILAFFRSWGWNR